MALPMSFQIMYWGITVSTALFGITMLQAWIYMHTNRDSWRSRGMVIFLVLIDAATTGLIGAIGYFYFVQSWGDPKALLNLPSFISIEPFLMFPAIFGIQLFFASRVRRLNKNWLAPAIITATATAAFGCGMGVSIMAFRTESMDLFKNPRARLLIGLHTGLSALSDIQATIFLTAWAVVGLKSCFESTRDMVKNLLLYLVTRGFLASFVQLGTCILFMAKPDSLFWTPFHFCMGRVYIITLLSMLNSRNERRMKDLTPSPVAFSEPSSGTPKIESRLVFEKNPNLSKEASIVSQASQRTNFSAV